MSSLVVSIKNSLQSAFETDYPGVISGFFVYGQHPENLPLISTIEGGLVSKQLQDSVIPYILIKEDSVIKYTATQISSCRVKNKPIYNIKVFFIGNEKYNAEVINNVINYYIGNMGHTLNSSSYNKFKVYEILQTPYSKKPDNVNTVLKNYSMTYSTFDVEYNSNEINKCGMPSICNGC